MLENVDKVGMELVTGASFMAGLVVIVLVGFVILLSKGGKK